MSTYLELQNQLADEIRPGKTAATIAGGVSQANLQTAILNAVKHYERRKFYFNQKTNTFSTVADQEYYDSSGLADLATLIEILAMTVTVSGSKFPVRSADFTALNVAQDGSAKSFPDYYAYFAQKIRLYPIPDAVYTIALAYHYRPTALAVDADTNAWTTDAEELIRNRARWDIATNKLRNDPMAARAKNNEMDALREILRETKQRISNSVLRVDPALVSPRPFNIYRG